MPLLIACGQSGGSAATDSSSPAQVVGVAATTAVSPEVATDENSQTMALWTQSDGAENGVYVNYFDISTGLWSVAEPIAGLTGMTYSPAVAIEPGGNAIAVWREYTNDHYRAWVKRYSGSSGSWSPVEAIASVSDTEVRSPQAAIDSQGNALVVWYQSDNQTLNIWSQSFRVDSGWAEPILLEQEVGSALSPRVAMDKQGNGLVAWVQSDGVRNNIQGVFYNNLAGWGQPFTVDSTDNTVLAPNVAMNVNGQALIAWYQWEGDKYTLQGNYFAGSWSGPRTIESDFAGGELDVQVAIAADGRAVATWKQHDGERQNVWRTVFDPASGWGLAEILNNANQLTDVTAKTAVAADGTLVAIWVEYGQEGSTLWGNAIH
ncbi:MAG: hypothetical protein C0623_06365 [Desulfuromonas sp.]|nr:MAG: hypothetical protein C0623_06365 [Desulfuromonas sp.]